VKEAAPPCWSRPGEIEQRKVVCAGAGYVVAVAAIGVGAGFLQHMRQRGRLGLRRRLCGGLSSCCLRRQCRFRIPANVFIESKQRCGKKWDVRM